MGWVIPFGKDAAMNTGMQGLHPAPEDFWGAGDLSHPGDRQMGGGQRSGRAAAGDQDIALGKQPLGQWHQSRFVRHTEESGGSHEARESCSANLDSGAALADPCGKPKLGWANGHKGQNGEPVHGRLPNTLGDLVQEPSSRSTVSPWWEMERQPGLAQSFDTWSLLIPRTACLP